MAREFRERGHILRLIEYMDVGSTNGWRLDDVVPAAELVAHDRRRAAARAGRGQLPRRGRPPLPLPRRQRRDRRDRLGHAALLRRLHARPPLGRRHALHLPVRDERATTCARSLRDGASDAELDGGDRRRLARPRATATRSSARPRRRSCRRSRCPSSAGSAGAVSGTSARAVECAGYAGPGRAAMTDAVVRAGRRYLPRGWTDLGRQLAIWFGFLLDLPARARASPTARRPQAFHNGLRVISFETQRQRALRAHLPADRAASPTGSRPR